MSNRFLSPDEPPSVARKQGASLTQTTKKTASGVEVESRAEGSELQGNIQATNISTADRDYYFFMKLTDLDHREINRDESLKVGQVYYFYISVSLNKAEPENLDLKKIKIKDSVALTIDTQDVEILNDQLIDFSITDDLKTWQKQILFKVNKIDKDIIQIRLNYQDGAIGTGLASKLTHKVLPSIDGEKDSSATEKVCVLGNILVGDDHIILYVNPNGATKWTIQGISPRDGESIDVEIPGSRTDLKAFSKKKLGRFTKWLYDRVVTFPNVAISDMTEEQISWERLLLQPGKYLGIEAKVVRWVEQIAWGGDSMIDPSKERIYKGEIISCSSHEPDLIEQWQIEVCQCAEKSGAIALINCPQTLDELDFNVAEQYPQENPLSLFLFANSPYSAQVQWQDTEANGAVALALSGIFSSYLGVITDIDPSYAQFIQKKFLKEAQTEKGIQPVEFLQRLRATFLRKKFRGNKAERDKVERMLEALFSYVYYGCPNDVVKVNGGEQ